MLFRNIRKWMCVFRSMECVYLWHFCSFHSSLQLMIFYYRLIQASKIRVIVVISAPRFLQPISASDLCTINCGHIRTRYLSNNKRRVQAPKK